MPLSWARYATVFRRLFFVWIVIFPAALFASDLFPVYDCIKPNVDFWVKVYSRYATTQGIVHDNLDLNIVYDVIDLVPFDEPGARAINQKRTAEARRKYETLLERLAQDPDTPDPQCRRVAALFGRRDAGSFAQAARRVRCQVGQKDRFLAGLIRSGAFIDEIKAILKTYGVPEDMAYLPHVESSFNPQAYSKFGAAGMWQFTRQTGRRFMEVGYVVDERRDPISATHAAAQLLKENFEKLGSWPLAITAYNHGASGMERAKGLHGDYPTIFRSYNSPMFQFASRNFYSEFLAARQVAANYAEYFGPVRLDRPRPTRSIKLKEFMAFRDLRRHFGVDAETLMELNPALRPPVFNGQKYIPRGYALRLPDKLFAQASPADAGMLEGLYKSSQKPSRFYTVQTGDSAGRIARMLNVRLDELILANNLDRRATIFPHQTLRIPTPGEFGTPAQQAPEPSGSVLLASAQSQAPEKTKSDEPGLTSAVLDEPAPAGAPAAAPAAELPAQVPSEPVAAEADGGEAVRKISEPAAEPLQEDLKSSGEPSTEPAAEQPSPPAPLLAGIVPLSSVQPVAAPPSDQTGGQDEGAVCNLGVVGADVHVLKVIKGSRGDIGIIQVEVEETLGHYAEWAGVRAQEIRRLNGLRFEEGLMLYQQIKIPLQRTSVQQFEENRYEYHKRLQEDFLAVYRPGKLSPYHVRSGDNYWSLCRGKLNIPMWLLKQCNPETDLAALHNDQVIMVPVIEKATADEPVVGSDDEEDSSGDQSGDQGDQSDPGASEEPEALKNVNSQVSP